MTTLKLLKRDIKLGIINRSFLLIIPIIFSLVMVKNCSVSVDAFRELKLCRENGTLLDYYVFSMQGMNYCRFDPKDGFRLPMLWFLFQMGISYFVAYYAEKDFVENGINVIIASKKRSSWWTAKVIWCMLSVVVYYLVSMISVMILAIWHGSEISFKISDFSQLCFGYNMTYLTVNDILLITVVVPLLTTISICLVQLILSFVFSPVTSFAPICCFYILSAYYTVWFLPANFTIWLRSSYFIEEGVNPISGILISLFLIVIVFVFGKYYFAQKDIGL